MPIDGVRSRQLVILYSAVFLDSIGFGLGIPLLPYYAISLGATTTQLALMAVAFNVGSLVGNVTLCALSDRVGRKPVLCTCLAATSVCYVALVLADSVWFLISMRIVSGFFCGTVACAKVYVADCTSDEERPQALASVNIAFACSIVIGPALGGLCALVAISFAFQVMAVVCFLNALAGWVLLTEPPRKDSKYGAGKVPPNKAKSGTAAVVRAQPMILVVIASSALQYLAYSALEALGALFILEQYGIGTSGFAGLMMFSGVVYVSTMKLAFVRTYNAVGGRKTAQIGHVFRGVGYLLLSVGSGWSFALAGMAGLGLGALITPANDTTLSIMCDPSSRGIVQGANMSVAAAMRTIGPLLAVPLFEVERRLPLLGSAFLMCFSTMVLQLLVDPHPQAPEASDGPLEPADHSASLPDGDPGSSWPVACRVGCHALDDVVEDAFEIADKSDRVALHQAVFS